MAGKTFQLQSPPQDVITSLNFHGGLYVTSFGGEIVLYRDVSAETTATPLLEDFDPITDSCVCKEHLLFGTTTGEVYQIDPNTKSTSLHIRHDSGVQCVAHNLGHNLIVTGSWDKSSFITNATSREKTHLQFDGKVQTLDTVGNYCVYGLSTGQNLIYDLRNLTKPLEKYDTGFQYPLSTCIRLMPQGQGYVQGSMEGKVSVQTFDHTSYTFKCHRTLLTDNTDFVGAVNDVCFLDDRQFFTGGSSVDRKVCLWDYTTKKRTKQIKYLPMGVSKLQYDRERKMLAIAMSDESYKNSVSLEEATLPDSPSVISIVCS